MPKNAQPTMLLSLLFAQVAQAQDYYTIDPVHTRVAFHIMHAGFSPSIGTVSKPSGHIWFDEKNPSKSSVEIQIAVSSLDMGDPGWNKKILDNTFLAADKFPIATFKSTAVSLESENHYKVEGLLSIAGQSISVTFNTTLNALKRHPLTLKQTLGLQASTQFSRKALGIDAWQSVVDDTVYMEVAVEATRAQPDKQEDVDAQ